MLKRTHGEEANAIYIRLSEQECASGEDLDLERGIDYAVDGRQGRTWPALTAASWPRSQP